MKWTLTSSPASTVHVFTLIDANTIKEVLRYNPLQRSARINCNGEQRVFFIEESGFRNGSFVFKNEYGFTVGRLTGDPAPGHGIMDIEERRFNYQLLESPLQELVIYAHEGFEPLLTCTFDEQATENFPALQRRDNVHEYAGLLLGLCWYVFSDESRATRNEPSLRATA